MPTFAARRVKNSLIRWDGKQMLRYASRWMKRRDYLHYAVATDGV